MNGMSIVRKDLVLLMGVIMKFIMNGIVNTIVIVERYRTIVALVDMQTMEEVVKDIDGQIKEEEDMGGKMLAR